MAYTCEVCGSENAKKNKIIEMILCTNCQETEYKLICKSDAMKKYNLTKKDIENYDYEEFNCRNPHYKSAAMMTLYYEKDIKNYIIEKYNDIITNELNILNPEDNLYESINNLYEYLQNKKNNTKKSKIDKILDKYNVELEDLPEEIQEELEESKTLTQYEKIIKKYIRKTDLMETLKLNNLDEYISLGVSTDYIQEKNTYTKDDVIQYIINSLEKKKIIKEAIKENNIPLQKYKYVINNFINSKKTNVKKFINELIEEENRYNYLVSKLKNRGLELRSDSKLCNDFLNGKSNYTIDYIVDVMEQMKWFYEHTKYPEYCEQYTSYIYYDKEEYNKKRSEFAKEKAIKDYIRGYIKVSPPSSLIDTIEEHKQKLTQSSIKQPTQDIVKSLSCSEFCQNIGSPNCINKNCKNCCKNKECTKHWKK